MKHLRVMLMGVVLVAGLGAPSTVAWAQSSSTARCLHFAETGHNVHGAFLAFYLSHNGTANLGLPLTEAFWEKGHVVQYFQLGRLELHPENPEPYRVLLGLLGEQFNMMDPPIDPRAIPPAGNPNFRYFPETGQVISFAIKEYFDKNGGVDVFGFPLTGLRFEAGSFVQYFQRQRLVWDPADNSANKVRPSSVGQIVLDKLYAADFKPRVKMPSDWCDRVANAGSTPTIAPYTPFDPQNQLNRITALQIQAHVQTRDTARTGPQFVSVTVDDQTGKRVPNAALYAIVRSQTGERFFPLLATDGQGKSSFSFEIGCQYPNMMVSIEVFGFWGAVQGVGRDYFTCR